MVTMSVSEAHDRFYEAWSDVPDAQDYAVKADATFSFLWKSADRIHAALKRGAQWASEKECIAGYTLACERLHGLVPLLGDGDAPLDAEDEAVVQRLLNGGAK
jgi:hypothetical protein